MQEKRQLVFILTLAFTIVVHSQTVVKPNFGLKSHETLEISKIETNSEKTVIFLTVENRIEKGSFCADKNIYLIDESGSRMKLSKSSGIPVCPESYRFKSAGEKLNFTLTFPPLKSGTMCVDLIEECSELCFSFYGIILDKSLNNNLDEAFGLAESGQSLKALEKFTAIAEANKNNNGSAALICFNIIKLANETGNSVKAAEWYKKLSSSALPAEKRYIEQLNLLGIRY
jgi:hypothetical protein